MDRIHIKTFIFSLLLFTTTLFSTEIQTSPQSKLFCVFTPPTDWQCADPVQLGKYVDVGFIGKGVGIIHPSINLASEEIDVSLEVYVADVKKMHQSDHNLTYHDLGYINTNEGKAHLAQIETKAKFATIQMLQLIILKNKNVFVLTGASKKEEFSKHYKTILSVFNSIKITNNLFDLVVENTKKEALKKAISTIMADQKDISPKDLEILQNKYSLAVLLTLLQKDKTFNLK